MLRNTQPTRGTMFAVRMFEIFKVYSSEYKAQQAVATFIVKTDLNKKLRAIPAIYSGVNDAYEYGQYNLVIELWNQYVHIICGANKADTYKVIIYQTEIDQPFI